MVRIVSTADLSGIVNADGYDTHADGYSLDTRYLGKKAKLAQQTSKTVPKTTSKSVTRVKSAKVDLNAKDMPLD